MMPFTMVEQNTCIACRICNLVVPNVLDHTADGFVFAFLDDNEGVIEVPEDLTEDLEDAFSCRGY
ncbi:ferredoxin [Sporosarcina sp. P34]|nr:ferredoxin [Sporosarcina sp. P16b]PID16992.1 ferredoxin [Sporosarcina sp. P34]